MGQPIGHLLRPEGAVTHRFAYLGVPHDAATSLGNPGARFAPAALRQAIKNTLAWRLQDGRMARFDRGIINLAGVELADFGDIPLSFHDTGRAVQETYEAVRGALEAGYLPIVVGGDHGVTFPAVKALHDTSQGLIGLVQLDAHRDLLDYSDRQGSFSGSSGARRVLELERLAGPNVVQVGLRGYATPEQYDAGEQFGVRFITARQFDELGARAAAQKALAWAGDGTEAVYLTIDMDALTPGEAPGTGWPEPGGLSAQQLLDFLEVVAPQISALDIAELNPVYDSPASTTIILAARILMDFMTAQL